MLKKRNFLQKMGGGVCVLAHFLLRERWFFCFYHFFNPRFYVMKFIIIYQQKTVKRARDFARTFF
jgi:hypothetical protein